MRKAGKRVIHRSKPVSFVNNSLFTLSYSLYMQIDICHANTVFFEEEALKQE